MSQAESDHTTAPEDCDYWAEQARAFDAAFQEWLAARAAIANLPKQGDAEADEAALGAACDRESRAENQMVAVRVGRPWQLVEKLEVIEHALIEADVHGRPADSHHLALLASFKIDLLQRLRD
jgi:hypothetical protein